MVEIIFKVFTILIHFNILAIYKFPIDNIDSINSVIWIDNRRIIINTLEEASIYDISKREIIENFEKEGNQIFGFDNGIVYCEWFNREIYSKEDYSTRIKKYSIDGEVLLDIELKPTVLIEKCGEKIVLKTTPPIEEKYYFFTDSLYEIDNYEKYIISPNFLSFITKDSFNRYWVNKISLTQR